MGQLWSGTRGPQSCVSPSVCVVQRWEQQRVTVLGRGEGAWPRSHLSVLLLQRRRAAFPGQVSGSVSLGAVPGQGTGARGLCCSLACINNQRNGVCGWKSHFQMASALG